MVIASERLESTLQSGVKRQHAAGVSLSGKTEAEEHGKEMMWQVTNLLTRTASDSIAIPAAASWSTTPLLPLPAIAMAAHNSCSTTASLFLRSAASALLAPALGVLLLLLPETSAAA